MNERRAESHVGCKIDRSSSPKASAKKENDIGNEHEAGDTSQLIFNPGTN